MQGKDLRRPDPRSKGGIGIAIGIAIGFDSDTDADSDTNLDKLAIEWNFRNRG